LKGHIERVNGAEELSNGRILSWSDDNTLRIWDAESGSPLALLKGHIERVNGAEELSNGRILSWSVDKTLRLWEVGNGASVGVLESHTDYILDVEVLSDRRILFMDDFTLHLLDVNGDTSNSAFEVPGDWNFTDSHLKKTSCGKWLYKAQHLLNFVPFRYESEKLLVSRIGKSFRIQHLIEPREVKTNQAENSKIRIARGGKTYGPYDRKRIEKGLASGRLVPTDWAWTQGMKEWTRLKDLLEE
jgi:WD40 repeat protein